MKLSQLNVLLIVASVIALTLMAVVVTDKPNRQQNILTGGAVLQATTSSASSSSSSSAHIYGENKLVLALHSATGALRKLGEKFIVGLQPQLIESTAVATIDTFVSFNPALVKATKIIELTTFAKSEKSIDNANGLITFSGIAASNGRFTNGQVLIQIEFEVISEDNVVLPLAVLENSTLGEPNTVAIDGFGKLNVTINNAPVVSVSSSSVSSSFSSHSSISSSSTTSTQFTNDVVTTQTTDWRTVITAGLIALAVSTGVGAIFVWIRQRGVTL